MTENPCVLGHGFMPSCFDVVCGRDNDSINHEGNRRLLTIINRNLEAYIQATNKHDKGRIINDITQYVRQSSPTGGFVRKDLDTGLWTEIGIVKAREKVGNLIRTEVRRRTKANGPPSTLQRSSSAQPQCLVIEHQSVHAAASLPGGSSMTSSIPLDHQIALSGDVNSPNPLPLPGVTAHTSQLAAARNPIGEDFPFTSSPTPPPFHQTVLQGNNKSFDDQTPQVATACKSTNEGIALPLINFSSKLFDEDDDIAPRLLPLPDNQTILESKRSRSPTEK